MSPCLASVMASTAAQLDRAPSVLGRHIETRALQTAPTADTSGLSSESKWRVAFTASLCIAIVILQVVAYFTSPLMCRADYTRFARWMWLSPLYIIGPWSAIGLTAIFVHRHDRFSPQMYIHRWTWRFALCNLVTAASGPASAMLRECERDAFPGRLIIGKAGEAIWFCSYAASEGILLCLVRYKVQALEQVCASRCLLCLFGSMLVFFILAVVPCLWWPVFRASPYRIFWMFCYMCAFIASVAIATRAMLNAAALAELGIQKSPAHKRGQLHVFIEWTRWTSRATLGCMSSSIITQVLNCVWLHYGCPTNVIRFALDWVQALSFLMNAWCAASLAGMIGPRQRLEVADTAFRELGHSLIDLPQQS